MRNRVLNLAPAFLFLAAALPACQPHIGDNCGSSVNCSINGDRVCDLSQPGGYCTVSGCEPGSCPKGSICVEFRPNPVRLSSTWCMATCSDNGDCRDSQGYRCVHAADLGPDVAEVQETNGEGDKFCAVQSNQ